MYCNFLSCVVTAVLQAETTAAQGVTPVDVTVFQGDKVTFNCSGTRVKWLRSRSDGRDQKLFSSWVDDYHGLSRAKFETIGQYYLVINNVDSTDGATYKCDTNENPSSTLNAALVVLGMAQLCL